MLRHPLRPIPHKQSQVQAFPIAEMLETFGKESWFGFGQWFEFGQCNVQLIPRVTEGKCVHVWLV